jgi:two-component system response regulator AtoC
MTADASPTAERRRDGVLPYLPELNVTSPKPRVLIVDDEPDVVANWARLLGRDDYPCITATDGEQARALLESERPDVVLTDLKMPGVDGMQVLARARDLDPDAVVIVITGHGTVESAVEAMRAGAFDYLLKPLPSNDVLRLAVARAAERRRLIDENRRLREPLAPRVGFDHIVGKSPAMLAVFDLVRKAARSDANILIEGESGTGKELIARAIHAQSPRAAEVFVPVDCAALPDTLLESELFGHERGAFTGADRLKPGMIEVAARGTLFLDEIGELPLPLQAKLLRALQERQIRRVGATRFVNVDVRLVSATNRDTAEAVRRGQFRQDLFYRVNVITITLPPLRDRAGDAALLAHHFLHRYGRNREPSLDGIDPEALACLEAYSWPGNVRELQNVIERACALADGPVIRARDLPGHVRERGGSAPVVPGTDLPLAAAREAWLQRFAETYLTDLLRRHGGNISQAARTAGVDRKTLHRLLAKHRIKP